MPSGEASRAPRIVITGDGAICALGSSVPEILGRLRTGGAGPMPPALRTTLRQAYPVFSVADLPEEPGEEGLHRTARLAMRATREAIRGAWPDGLPVAPERVGVCLGTTVGCTLNDEPFYLAYRSGQAPGADALRRYVAHELAVLVADAIGAQGPVATVANACASGADAIGLAASWIASGQCDVAVAGGADELARYPYVEFALLQNVATEPCRPFDLHRNGLNLGEGAGVVVLEREDDARRRGAPILGALLAHASAADAHHATAPHPDGRGLRDALHKALCLAGVSAQDVGFVNAHGTGTVDNDRVEGKVLAELLPPGTAMFSTKGHIGHTLGAAGAIEAVFTLHNLLEQWVPRSAGFETPDPACCIVPTTQTMPLHCRVAISTSLAFGGTNTVLVIGRGEAA
jgi:3-oxoacyl-[acyl-carrier-protein] synthase II